MFLAEVVAVHVSEDYMEGNGRFRLNQTGLVAYSHGEYFSLGKKLGTFGYSVRKPAKKKENIADKHKKRRKVSKNRSCVFSTAHSNLHLA